MPQRLKEASPSDFKVHSRPTIETSHLTGEIQDRMWGYMALATS